MKTGAISFALALILGLGCNLADARTTRDLVFEDDEAPAQAEQGGAETIALKTTVALERDGQKLTVAPSHEFKSGDKVKMVFTPNADGYVYWLAKGTSGKYTMLFPSSSAGSDNQVKRNQEYTVPVKGAFRFDDTPGNEELLCILSTERLPDLDKAAEEQFKNAAEVAKLETNHEKKRTTRDLVFEDEEEEDVNTKTQKAAPGEPFVAGFTLKHN